MTSCHSRTDSIFNTELICEPLQHRAGKLKREPQLVSKIRTNPQITIGNTPGTRVGPGFHDGT